MHGVVIWLTGPSGAGKSTVAQQLRKELAALGRNPEVLDHPCLSPHQRGSSSTHQPTGLRQRYSTWIWVEPSGICHHCRPLAGSAP